MRQRVSPREHLRRGNASNVVRFAKHKMCRTVAGLAQPSTSSLDACGKDMDGRHAAGHDDRRGGESFALRVVLFRSRP
jgi:hypothetical protein